MNSYYTENLIEAGCDEVGRGCLAGSLFAAAVILPKDFSHPLLRDSKKMTHKQRLAVREVIIKEAIAWSIAEVSAEEIDEINILNASFLGMTRAVKGLSVSPELLLIDGNRWKSELTTPHQCIIKGDDLYASIAAASVLAKTERDNYITLCAEQYPEYGWSKNKAYPTKQHREAIAQYGITPLHRKTFKLSEI
ncbi:MAG: ribonuclease HII [Rikenellaceae bacterium]